MVKSLVSGSNNKITDGIRSSGCMDPCEYKSPDVGPPTSTSGFMMKILK